MKEDRSEKKVRPGNAQLYRDVGKAVVSAGYYPGVAGRYAIHFNAIANVIITRSQ